MAFVVLVGPKHSGKTTAGRELALRLGLPFFDLDLLVEERTGQSPRALYRLGPELFRAEEAKALGALPAGNPAPGITGILAAGGGIIDNPRAMALLAGHITVYLDISAETAWRRITGNRRDPELPPFLQAESMDASRQKHRLLHERRSAAYRAAAQISISAESKTAAETAEEVGVKLRKNFWNLRFYRPPMLPKGSKKGYTAGMDQEKFFSAILQNIHDGIIVLDKDLCITFVNAAALKISGWETAPLDEAASRTFTLLESLNLTNLVGKKLPRNTDPLIFKDAIYKCGPHTSIVDGSIARIPEEESHETAGYVIVIRDISEFKKLSASLDYHVSHDSLTGLINREGFIMELEDILDSVKRVGEDCGLLQIDIDSYNAVKAETGEPGGNALLTWFAQILQADLKHRDISGRLGGSVFTVILLDCIPAKMKNVAKRLHTSVSRGFSFENKTFPVTISIGMVPISEKAAFAAGILSAVDNACNAAKKAGGGRTVSG
ncbi:MAG: diguanylate cyclase [Treponema sp.]|nr:diguanylate cyclase [Treponema sp.]